MINDVRATERYLTHREKLYCCMYGSPQPSHSQQQAAHTRPHDGHVVKRLRDGHRVVIGYHGEEEDAHSTKEVLSQELGRAAFQGDGSTLREAVHNHLGCNGRRVGGIQKGHKDKERAFKFNQATFLYFCFYFQ